MRKTELIVAFDLFFAICFVTLWGVLPLVSGSLVVALLFDLVSSSFLLSNFTTDFLCLFLSQTFIPGRRDLSRKMNIQFLDPLLI